MLRRNFLAALTALFPSLAGTRLLAKEPLVEHEPEQPYLVIQDDWIKRGITYRRLNIPKDVLDKLFENVEFEQEIDQKLNKQGPITNTIAKRRIKVFLPQHHAYETVLESGIRRLVWGTMEIVQQLESGFLDASGKPLNSYWHWQRGLVTYISPCEESHKIETNEAIYYQSSSDDDLIEFWQKKAAENASVYSKETLELKEMNHVA